MSVCVSVDVHNGYMNVRHYANFSFFSLTIFLYLYVCVCVCGCTQWIYE